MLSIRLLFTATFLSFCVVKGLVAEPIFHEKHYPKGDGPFPAVIALHTSGGFKTVKHLIQRYVDNGFVVYAPDFFYATRPRSGEPDGNVLNVPQSDRG